MHRSGLRSACIPSVWSAVNWSGQRSRGGSLKCHDDFRTPRRHESRPDNQYTVMDRQRIPCSSTNHFLPGSLPLGERRFSAFCVPQSAICIPRCALLTRTAHTLNSGILEIGSRTRLVTRFADRSPGQWYGMKIVSGRIVFTTSAGHVNSP